MPRVSQSRGVLPTVYIGIDPGMSGGLVALFYTRESSWVELTSMPTTEKDIWDWVSRWSPLSKPSNNNPMAVIEKVHSMPKQGVASTFKFGMGYGGLRMALIAAHIPFEEVTPQAWLKGLSIPSVKKGGTPAEWKNFLKSKAQALYPEVEVTLKTADALLIATYCLRKHTGTL